MLGLTCRQPMCHRYRMMKELGVWDEEYGNKVCDPGWLKVELTSKLTSQTARVMLRSAQGQGLQIYSFRE